MLLILIISLRVELFTNMYGLEVFTACLLSMKLDS